MQNPAVYFYEFGQRVTMEKAEQIVDHLQQDGLTPVKSGALLNSYKAEPYDNGAAVVTDKDYWIYVEYGTSEQNAQPHVGPAIEAARGD